MLCFFVTAVMSSFLAINANRMTIYCGLESVNQCYVVETPGRNKSIESDLILNRAIKVILG